MKIYHIYVIFNGDSIPFEVKTDATGTADEINTSTVVYRILCEEHAEAKERAAIRK
jgi:hypothetical protein